MKSADKLAGCSQPTKSCFGKGTLKGCTTSRKGDNIVLIDVESDDMPAVIILDIPESLQQKLGKSRVDNVINIDDDGSDDDADTVGSCNMEVDATASSRGFEKPASSNPARSDGESRQFFGEGDSPVNLSKCKRTYSGKSGSRNRYGMTLESERSSSDSDSSDCECMEGSFGKLHKQWEKAFSKRKHDISNVRPGPDHQAGLSASHPASENNSREEHAGPASHPVSENNSREEHAGPASHPVSETNSREEHAADRVESSNPFSTPRTTHESERTSSFAAHHDDGRLRNNTLNQERGNPFAHMPQEKAEQEPFSQKKSSDRQRVWPEDYSPNLPEQQPPELFNICPFGRKEVGSQDATLNSAQKVGIALDHQGQHFPRDTIFEPCSYNRQHSIDEISDCHMADAHDEEVSSSQCWFSKDLSFNNNVSCANVVDEPLPTSCTMHFGRNDSPEPEDLIARESLFEDFKLYNGSREDFAHTKSTCQEARNTAPIESLRNSSGLQSTPNNLDNSEVQVRDPSRGLTMDEKNDTSSGLLNTGCKQMDIITDRQKIKDTDEYKRALEEELEARRQQLQIQAEEAQRLRKRKRAEAMRITDVERRQKQRVDEIRQTLRKDEENMNLKEQIRADVRKKLKLLETSCGTLTSLLRGLGIHVGGDFLPSTQEVQAAYKRAVLKFHPDRVSGGDLREQVEAEEKFKLIARMKEKLLPKT